MEINASSQVSLSSEEKSYLLGLLKEHLDYYQLLATRGKCSAKHQASAALVQTLWIKLSQ